ncbi:MAG: hypothetical protein SVY53_03235 [Chloroflexota bacterium]|nr:hypothetical protein [Chloroflexota bacterium]
MENKLEQLIAKWGPVIIFCRKGSRTIQYEVGDDDFVAPVAYLNGVTIEEALAQADDDGIPSLGICPTWLNRDVCQNCGAKISTEEKEELSASEALVGFCGWLTTREENTIMSAADDCAPIVELIKEFCEVNQLADPRDDWHKHLIHPE